MSAVTKTYSREAIDLVTAWVEAGDNARRFAHHTGLWEQYNAVRVEAMNVIMDNEEALDAFAHYVIAEPDVRPARPVLKARD